MSELLHAGQQEVHRSTARYRVVACGRRWGKTRLCVYEAVLAASRGKQVLWVAPTHDQARIAWRLARVLIGGRAEIRRAEKRAVFERGGVVRFASGDDYDHLRGEAADLLVLDEADYQAEEAWTAVLRPALADRAGRALLVSTPRVSHGWFHALYERGQRGEPGWASWSQPSWTNPYLPAGEVDEARRVVPELTFRREFGAEFVSAEGARVRAEWLREGQPPVGMARVMGVDLAISTKRSADYTAAVVMGRDEAGRVWILHVARTRAPFHEQLDWIGGLAAAWNVDVVGVEDVAYQRAAVQELLRTTSLTVRAVRPVGDKVSRFAALEARYQQGQVWHGPGLAEAWTDELLSFPAGVHDDQVDAAVVAWACLPHEYAEPDVPDDPVEARDLAEFAAEKELSWWER